MNRNCPCCAFDTFLPQSLLEGNQADQPQKDEPKLDPTLEIPVSPEEAAAQIAASESPLIIVDTHGHAQLDRDQDDAYNISFSEESINFKSITCAVAPDDWNATLDFASKSDSILPALGVHPWYLEGLQNDWLEKLQKLLLEHPSCIVGEIGLCKMARFVRNHPEGKAFALGVQRDVFKKQMVLAASLRRPVSVHCVNQHGVFVSVIKELLKEGKGDNKVTTALPPAIGMHSFTGTAHHVKELLGLEKLHSPEKPLFYFGFSHAVSIHQQHDCMDY